MAEHRQLLDSLFILAFPEAQVPIDPIEAAKLIGKKVLGAKMREMEAHRAGFTEACDLMGLPASDTPMERIALAGRVPE